MTILLQLGRLGDLMILQPAAEYLRVAGFDARIMCCRRYADLLGIPCLPWHKTERDWREAYELARTFTDDVRITQIGGTGLPKVKENFCFEFFNRADVPLELFNDLKLELPRWPDAERHLVAKYVRIDRPLILYNFQSCSFRIEQGPAIAQWLSDSFGHGCELVDLGGIRVERMSHLLGLYQRAAILVTIDTATLHLSWQTRTPTAAILNDTAYAAPPPRPHWKWYAPYRDFEKRLNDLRTAITNATGIEAAFSSFRPQYPPPDLANLICELEGGAPADDMVSRRARICRGCEHARVDGAVVVGCNAWPGPIWNYIRNPFEHCPADRWESEA